MKSWKKPTPETVEKALASTKRETDRIYFFSRLRNPWWLDELESRGYFRFPPGAKQLPDGYVQYPSWPELNYVSTVADVWPDRAIDVLLSIPKTDNVRIYHDILEIAIKLKVDKSVRLRPKLIEHVMNQPSFFGHGFGNLLRNWSSDPSGHKPALDLVKDLVSFVPDAEMTNKIARHRNGTEDILTALEPEPRFEEWEYHEIIETGVKALAKILPFDVAVILYSALRDMVALKVHTKEPGRDRWEDWSDLWVPRVNGRMQGYSDAKEELVFATTYACEQVYEKEPDKMPALDEQLRKQNWRIFDRIRQHLYANYPNEITKPWIREQILGHQDYGRREYRYEFHRMVRAATEHIGESLLSTEERVRIFEAILEGPSKEDFRQFVGEDFSEELFEKRRRYFHLKQLSPFRAVLFERYRSYAEEIAAEEGRWLSEEDCLPFKSSGVKEVQEKSPTAFNELERMGDEELLQFINEWEDVERDPEHWWINISFEGLGREFQRVFRERIVPERDRLRFWLENVNRIERPLYLRRIILALTDVVKTREFSQLERIFNLCDWVLTHPDLPKSDEGRSEVSRELPCWRPSRRAVCDFIGICLDEEVMIPSEWRDRCAGILAKLCMEYDGRLDEDDPVFLNREDQLTEAINQTRGRALENLVNFGRWVRRHNGNDAPVPEVFEVIEQRFDSGPNITLPEHALLGMQFGGLFSLDQRWAERKKGSIFPQGKEAWAEAFGNYLRFNRPFRGIFPLVQPEFEFALGNTGALRSEKHQRKEIIDSIGEHLFAYYVWGMIPLEGEESILSRFYTATESHPEYWSRLFDHVGRSLKNSGGGLSDEFLRRIREFFECRLSVKNLEELSEVTFWLEAESLSAEWRLRSFSQILDLGPTKGIGLSIQLEALNKMLADEPDLVVECFAKMTDLGIAEEYFYFQPKNAKPILRYGLLSKNLETKAAAERARENLLKAGRFEFLHVEEEDSNEEG